jgi:hypothetical protein
VDVAVGPCNYPLFENVVYWDNLRAFLRLDGTMSSSDMEMVDSGQSESELSQQLVEVDVIVGAAYKPGPERLT